MNMRTAKLLLLSASVATLAASPAFAASTADEAVEMVTVTAARTTTTGFVDEHISKQRSTVTQAFFDTQPAGQTIFQGLNMVPGLNFTSTDPYGASGGDLRLHGLDGAHISFTWDGMPLNDTGNYAIFTNQIVDPELVDNVIVNQGTTDVDTPTASAVGGVIGITTAKPLDTFGVLGQFSYGSDDFKRGFIRVDSGEIGPWGTKAFGSFSFQDYDKFKGPGHEQRKQLNGYIYQDLGAVGFFGIGVHFNQNRNNFYNNQTFIPVRATSAYTHVASPSGVLAASTDGFANSNIASPNVALDNDGNFSGVLPLAGPIPLGGFGLAFDEDPTCARVTPVAGTTQIDSACTGFYKVRINPSDTGNIRASSLFHINDVLAVTFDPSFQYVLANGGGYTVINERDHRLHGTGAGTGKDLNGDGDVLDQIGLYTPNNTNTRRYGLSTSVIWTPSDEHTVQVAYTLDWGLHRQTANYATFDNVTGPVDPFGGLRPNSNRVVGSDSVPLRGRDRKSYAIMNQFSLAYNGKYWDDLVRLDIGLRLPFLERDLNQYCYVQATGSFTQVTPGVGFQYCTSQAPSAVAADGTVTFAGVTVDDIPGGPNTGGARFTPPGSEVVRYNRLLPNAGVTYRLNHQDTHQFFFAYATELSAPRTDNLYNGGVTGFGTPAIHYSSFATVSPETSTSYDLGYRYHGDSEHISVTLWNTQYKHRIVSTFDANQGISIDHDIGPVNMSGIDVEGGVDVDDSLSIMGTYSYDHSRVVNDLALGASALSGAGLPAGYYVSGGVLFARTSGKQFVETPTHQGTFRAQYTMWGFRIGVNGKFVGKRPATENNDFYVPSYFTADADVTYDLGELGWEGSYIKFNASNLFDKQYYGSVGTSRSCFTYTAPTVPGCTSAPALVLGAPQTFMVTFRAVY